MGHLRLDASASRFDAYVEGLVRVIGHADRAKPLRDYCMGLMMPCERKSVEPMAAITAPESMLRRSDQTPNPVQKFVTQ
jgi:SRSO17 transposase